MVEKIAPTELYLTIVESNPPAVWKNMVDYGIVPKSAMMPLTPEEVMVMLYKGIEKSSFGDKTLVLSHVLDVPPLYADNLASQDVESYRAMATSGDLVLINTIRNNEDCFKLYTKQEESFTGFLALLGVIFLIYLIYKVVKKLLK